MTSRSSHSLMLAAALAAFAAPAHAEGWSFSTGADYTSGDYGEAVDTNIWIVPFTAGYSTDRWRIGVTVPYVRLEGSGNIIPGTGAGTTGASSGANASTPLGLGGSGGLLNTGLFGSSAPSASPPPTPVRIAEEGLGDVTLSLGVTPYVGDAGDRFTLGLDLRTPTGDEDRSLGAGQSIGALSAEYAHPLGDRAAIYAALGYQRAFDTEDESTTATIGAESYLSDRFLLGASASWAEASLDNQPNETEATLYASFAATDHVRLVGYALAGLSDTAPNSGAGFRIVLH
ncbi:MAG TPA: hypothetical protein VG943_13015 [Caulobacterales bacterium]|nr:hypothetical protein [Caulobacterales bacterium]